VVGGWRPQEQSRYPRLVREEKGDIVRVRSCLPHGNGLLTTLALHGHLSMQEPEGAFKSSWDLTTSLLNTAHAPYCFFSFFLKAAEKGGL
jgi:hypothetical protein